MAPNDPTSLAKRGAQLRGIVIALLVLSWFFIALRVWTRTFIRSNFGWDDATMIMAGMVFSAYSAGLLYIEANGGGTHIDSVAQLNDLTKRAIAVNVTYVVTVMLLKISLGIFFVRIVIQRWQLVTIYSAVTISCVSSISSFFYLLFRCGPDLDQMLFLQLAGQCASRTLDRFFAYQHAAAAFLTDCVFLLLPIPILWNTNMNRKAKVSVGLILSLAATGCVCSAIRFRYVDGLTDMEDFFWNSVNIAIWSTIEPGTGIMAGCTATLRPLIERIFNQAKSLRSTISQASTLVRSNHLKSTQSNSNSSVQKNAIRLNQADHDASLFRQDSDAVSGVQQHELRDIRTANSRSRGSTERILSDTVLGQDGSFGLDRTSRCTSGDQQLEESLRQPPRTWHHAIYGHKEDV